MDYATIRILLPLYSLGYFLLCFVWRTVAVWRRTGINPLVFGRSESGYDYVGKLFKLVLGVLAAHVAVYSSSEQLARYLVPISYLQAGWLKMAGWGLLLFSLVWTMVAQAQMGNSWRIGVDLSRQTELVAKGLFRVSRNPIFVGMIATLVGMFLLTPDAVMLVVVVLGCVLISIQIRLEEEYLGQRHGETYRRYRQAVRRWL